MHNIKVNPKFFFKYCKKFSKTQVRVGPLQAENGEISKNSEETCHILSQQYIKVLSQPKPSKIVHDPSEFFKDHIQHHRNLANITFSTADLQRAISELKMNSAAGPDGVPSILLVKCKEALANPLYKIWRCSLDTGIIPTILKEAVISPIHKGGDRTQAKNYRPVALTSHLVKIFEKIVRDAIITHLDANDLMSGSQHGFRKGRSCLSNLLAHYEWLLQGLAEGRNVDVVYLDFAKAFDRVDHGILLHKLRAMGITGKLGVWLHGFLTRRKQAVAVDGFKSQQEEVISGVPQGSVLGPMLFLVLMADIEDAVDGSFLSSFADDTTLSHRISEESDVTKLQLNIGKIYKWAEANNMKFNDEKFELLRLGPNTDVKSSTNLYTGGQQDITPSHVVKCLGVHMNDDATFHHHIKETTTKARRMVGWVLRTFRSREQEVMLALWKALIQPVLDYCSQLWSPHKKAEIQELESVQRAFTRTIKDMKGLNYWQRLQKLGLYSQQRRRERYRAIYVWKILEKHVPDPTTKPLKAKESERTGRSCERCALSSTTPVRIKNILASSLTHSGPRLFNALPRHVRDTTGCSVTRFKKNLDDFLQTLPDEPPVSGYTAYCRAASNSVLDQMALLKEDSRTTGSSGGQPHL